MFFTQSNCSSCKGPVGQAYRYHVAASLVWPILAGYCLANVSQWITKNFEEMFSSQINHLDRPARTPCKSLVELTYRTILIPVWFGHFWLASLTQRVLINSSKNSRKCFYARQPSSLSFEGPMGQAYRTTLMLVWFGQSWLPTIRPTCLNQFLEKFAEMFFSLKSSIETALRESRGTKLLGVR